MDKQWQELASEQLVETATAALAENGIRVILVDDGQAAKSKLLELIPPGSQVMTMSSQTLEQLGIASELNSDKYNSVREKFSSMDKETQAQEMNQLGAAPEYAVGSVHAITADGHCLIASNSGSQLPAYAYSAMNVIWVAGTQKLVKNTAEGIDRVYQYCLPLEDKRAREAYGSGSGVNKLLVFNREIKEKRVTLILVKEKLGF